MRRALVVHAHPASASFSRTLCDVAVAGLEAAGHEVTVQRLYDDGFEAAMSATEHERYDTDSPVVDPLVRRFAEQLLASDIVVFVYPTWWWGPPAILKGWFDRVLVPGVAFRVTESGRVVGSLRGIDRVVGITTYGAPGWVARLAPDAGRLMIRRNFRLLMGRRGRSSWLTLAGIDGATQSRREAFLDEVQHAMADT